MEAKSFSEFLKNEILEFNWTNIQLKILFYSFLRTNGVSKKGNYIVTTTLKKWKEKILKMFLDFYDVEPEIIETDKLIKFKIKSEQFKDKFFNEIGKLNLNNIEENKAYISGAYLGKGWVNSPASRFYHLEIRVKHLSHSLDIQEGFDGLGIQTSTFLKNGWYYTYIKKAVDISTTLSAFNASESLMIFEDSRIERDFIFTYKKMESIEQFNNAKIKQSSKKQTDAINELKRKNIFDSMKEDEKKIAELRLIYPEYSLSELQQEFIQRFDKEISRSLVNIIFKKIILLVEDKKND